MRWNAGDARPGGYCRKLQPVLGPARRGRAGLSSAPRLRQGIRGLRHTVNMATKRLRYSTWQAEAMAREPCASNAFVHRRADRSGSRLFVASERARRRHVLRWRHHHCLRRWVSSILQPGTLANGAGGVGAVWDS